MKSGWDVLDRARAEHDPVAFRVMISGGHDSLCCTSVAFDWARERGIDLHAAHINTGTGVPQTTEFVREVCAANDWPFIELVPREDRDYAWLVKRFGFPGPGQHALAYRYLKERQLDLLVRVAKEGHPRNARVMLITGVREQESVRRMAHVKPIQRQGGKVYAAPIWDWSKLDCNRWIEEKGLPRNPVVDILHMSGECLCGAFAKPGEMKEIETWFPDVADRLHALEAEVEAEGQPGCVWGQRPPRVHRDQMKLEVGLLCQGCELRTAP